MEFLIKSKSVTCILTTHFIEVCKRLDTHKAIENYYMKTEQKEQKEYKSDFNYTYILKKGISHLRGGLKILHDMNYPKEIIDKTREFQ